MKNSKGITLIALVITIIVLLILAGVSIATISGDNGIVEKASEVKENTRAAEIKESIDLVLAENMIQEETDKEYITKTELVEKLVSSNKLTTEEKQKLQTEDKIMIGNTEISFEELSKYSIHFTINGVSYEAERGMIWEEWTKSEYNTSEFTTYPNLNHVVDIEVERWVVEYDGNFSMAQAWDDEIDDNKDYYTLDYGEIEG